ncbi:hypothetical protein SAY86_010265 [Trapa natans]|uniref:Uncharacterized protein n=1 Tax=Trapa natans TaxID=22666 RepID=A0AAN7L5D4_TRANT|nr:hypothetical protein SAY86_010265 [Trapa natans]
MGCTTSRLDDLPAVALCRDRCGFLEEAIRQRYALSEAHVAYTRSLASVARSLHQFLEHSNQADLGHVSSRVLDLPPKGKGDKGAEIDSANPKKEGVVHNNPVLDSGSHIDFRSDDDDEDDSTSSSLHLHSERIEYISTDHEESASNRFYGGVHMSYMKNMAAPAHVVYEQRLPAMSKETVHYFGEGEKSSLYHPYPYYEANIYSNGGGIPYLYPGYSLPSTNYWPPSAVSASKPPPALPSPPRPSALDFLNFFDIYEDNYYMQDESCSRDSKELREEEGIPDLEEERVEVVKEMEKVHEEELGDIKPADKTTDDAAADVKVQGETPIGHESGSINLSSDGDQEDYEVHVVEGVRSEPRPSSGCGSAAAGAKVFQDVSEVMKEIEIQFERASEMGNEIAKMLEAGKLPYHRKHHQVSLQGPTSRIKPISSAKKTEAAHLSHEEEVGMKSGNLSSTLQKLYFLEMKLHHEVKAEEKMRVVHDRKLEKLKRLDRTGAKAHKINSANAVVKSLSSKIRIAIDVVDRISVMINKIRDEELWPQLNELIQGLSRMWKSMLQCHQSQCQAIKQVTGLDPMGSGKKLDDSQLDVTLQFQHELLYWAERFSVWVSAQKGFIKALNNCLLKCLLYEPEETPDGIVPFSPGRMGAPPVFVICNQWSESLDHITDMEVVQSLHVLATSVFQLLERDKLDMQRKIVADKSLGRKVRDQDQKMLKEIQTLEKKIVLVSGEGGTVSASGHIVHRSDVSSYNFQASMQRIFEAMEIFTEKSAGIYVDLLQRMAEVEGSAVLTN